MKHTVEGLRATAEAVATKAVAEGETPQLLRIIKLARLMEQATWQKWDRLQHQGTMLGLRILLTFGR